MDWIVSACKDFECELIKIRRELHMIPEIGNELPLTREYVCKCLEKWEIPYRKNKKDDGVIVDIEGASDGKTVAFRADMDGLNITEETNVDFRSRVDGRMHACGHDAHTAILLSVAKILFENKEKICGRVRLLFQTGEETGTGAKKMLSSGELDRVDAIFALHVGNLAGNEMRAGEIAIFSGPVSAGKDKFTITVKGKGTHSAFPEKGVDPILIAARIVNGCEELNARELPAGSAAVLSFGSLNAGIDHNTIPDTAVIKGSIRCQDEELRDFLGNRLKCIATHIAEAYRGECQVDLVKGSSSVVNDIHLAELAYDAVASVLENDKVVNIRKSALMGSDDFANYLKLIPGVYFFLHTNNPDKKITEPNHSARFDIDESVLWRGAASYIAIADQYLKINFNRENEK